MLVNRKTKYTKIGGLASIGVRAYLSKIIDKDELGKIFSLISAIDGSIPLIGNVFFTLIFTQTLDNFPGAVFDASAGLLLLPLSALIFIDVFCRKSPKSVDHNMNNKSKAKDKENNTTEEQLTYRTKGGTALRQNFTDI